MKIKTVLIAVLFVTMCVKLAAQDRPANRAGAMTVEQAVIGNCEASGSLR
jgi:hypothetical protein